QLDVEAIEPRLRLEGEPQPAAQNLVAQLEAAIPLLAEQRIPEDHVRPLLDVAQPLDLVGDVRDRSHAVAGQDPVGAIRAELGTSAARQQWEPAADGTRRPSDPEFPAAILADEIPTRERQGIEIGNLLARD